MEQESTILGEEHLNLEKPTDLLPLDRFSTGNAVFHIAVPGSYSLLALYTVSVAWIALETLGTINLLPAA